MGAFARSLSALKSRISLRSTDVPLTQSLDAELVELAADHPPKLISIDIFDTLLLRNGKCEARRFWEISEAVRRELATEGTGTPLTTQDFFIARYVAMQAGYAGGECVLGCREGQIPQVLATQIDLLGLPPRVQPLLLEIELDYEVRNLKGNEFLLAALEAAFAAVPLIGLSDMYLGRAHIESLIERIFHGRCHLHSIFSSADIVVNKRNGAAYSCVAKAMGIGTADILHIGDAVRADLLQAQRSGCKAFLFPVTHAEINARRRDFDRFLEERRKEGLAVEEYATL